MYGSGILSLTTRATTACIAAKPQTIPASMTLISSVKVESHHQAIFRRSHLATASALALDLAQPALVI
jgi:hypothetical protein